MSDDEPDYMSEDFITSCVSTDVRPGLLFSRQQQRAVTVERRRREAEDRHRQQHQPRHQLQQQRLQLGLTQPLDESNKGFALLQKMGYKPGQSLGKQEGGIVEPIAIALKQDRAGLGRQAALDAMRQRKQHMWAAKRRDRATNAAATADQFRRRMRDKMADRHVQVDLAQSQRACQQLDESIGVECGAEPWFWPQPAPPSPPASPSTPALASSSADVSDGHIGGAAVAPEESDSEESLSTGEQLELLTEYLRKSHGYCVWCGCSYDDEQQLLQQCPGNTRQDHD